MSEFHSEYGWGHFPAPQTNLNPKQFAPHIYYEADPTRPTSNFGHQVAGIKMYSHEPSDPKSEEIGRFEWSKTRGEILNVDVNEDYRRRGVATAMYRAAQHIAARTGVPAPEMSSDRSEMGDRWAKSLGVKLPPLWRPNE